MKHSPEPWEIDEFKGMTLGISASDGDAVVWCSELVEEGISNQADAHRIVECVNACAGIEDPETTIRRAAEVLRLALERIEELCKRSDSHFSGYTVEQINRMIAKLEGKNQ